jgi:carbamoyl-phosphate synthase large subunit
VLPGEEFSIDVFCDLDGRCLNAIPRTMIQSKGGESIKGMTIQDRDLIEFGAASPRRSASSARHDPVLPRADGRHEVTDVNPRFGGAFPLPLAAGSRYPELALAARARRAAGAAARRLPGGVVMTRFFSHLCLTRTTAAA